MVTCCGFCGADLSYRPPTGVFGRIEDRCPDCGLDAESDFPSLVPTAEEMGYDFSEWETSDRLILRRVLVDREIPFRWEPGPQLAVHENDVVLVEEVLDNFDDLASEEVASVPEPGDQAASEKSYKAMASLFVVADRLTRSGWDPQLGVDMVLLEEAVRDADPPFGIEARTWREVQVLAEDLCNQIDEKADDDEIVGTSLALRDTLKPLV